MFRSLLSALLVLIDLCTFLLQALNTMRQRLKKHMPAYADMMVTFRAAPDSTEEEEEEEPEDEDEDSTDDDEDGEVRRNQRRGQGQMLGGIWARIQAGARAHTMAGIGTRLRLWLRRMQGREEQPGHQHGVAAEASVETR